MTNEERVTKIFKDRGYYPQWHWELYQAVVAALNEAERSGQADNQKYEGRVVK